MDQKRNGAAELELRHLRCLVAIVDTGSFTDAAIELGTSQATVSRNLLALEKILGVRLLHRTSRTVTPTTAGVRALARARPLLSGAEELVTEAATGHSRLHIGHAWSAFGRHTTEFQRRWHHSHPETELRLIRHNSSTGGLAEGLCDLAIIRAPLDLKPWSHALVGHEPRCLALASDDPWARRRGVRMDEIPERALAIDRRTGTTTLDLWPEGEQPAVEYTQDVDDWLAAIATGRCVGVTPPGDRRPVPAGRHHLSPVVRHRPGSRTPHLAPAGPPSRHPRRSRSCHRPVPPGLSHPGPLARMTVAGVPRAPRRRSRFRGAPLALAAPNSGVAHAGSDGPPRPA